VEFGGVPGERSQSIDREMDFADWATHVKNHHVGHPVAPQEGREIPRGARNDGAVFSAIR